MGICGTLQAKGRIAFNAFFKRSTRAVALKHCAKVDRTLSKLLIAYSFTC